MPIIFEYAILLLALIVVIVFSADFVRKGIIVISTKKYQIQLKNGEIITYKGNWAVLLGITHVITGAAFLSFLLWFFITV